MALTVRVITPDKTVWDDSTVQEVILPSTSGQLGILAGHAPLLTAIDIGVMRVRPGKDWQNIAVYGGFAEVEDNKVKVLVNAADLGSTIDTEAAKTAFEAARTALEEATRSGDRRQLMKAEKTFKKARAKFQAAGGMVSL